MKNHEKGPGIRSDRPGITLNNLNLDVSATCLREKERERELLRVWGWFGGEWKRPGHISPRVTGPTILHRRGLFATSRRTVRLYNFWLSFPLKLPLVKFFSTQADHPRTLGGPSALCSVNTSLVYSKLTGAFGRPFAVHKQSVRCTFCSWTSLCCKILLNGGPSTHYPRTVRDHYGRTARINLD